LSGNLGASAFWNPLGLSRPVKGLLYLYLILLQKLEEKRHSWEDGIKRN